MVNLLIDILIYLIIFFYNRGCFNFILYIVFVLLKKYIFFSNRSFIFLIFIFGNVVWVFNWFL